MITVLGRRRDGSDIAEAFLIHAGIPYQFRSLDYDQAGPDRDELLRLNPLAQVPTLILEDGTILTETLAVAAYAQATRPKVRLIPEGQPLFWRYALILVAQIYPTFTYGDNPEKWVGETGASALRKSTENRCKELWTYLESEVKGSYFLGEEMSALDIYVKVMLGWRPGKSWFESHTPKLCGIQKRIEEDPSFKPLEW